MPGAGTYHPNLIEVPKKQHVDMSNAERFKAGANELASVNWPGPAAYKIPESKGASYSLGSRFDEPRAPMFKKADGSRFDSQIRAKPHLHPKKMDGPGPGDYEAPSSIKKPNRHTHSMQMSTFGGGERNKLNNSFNTPGPNHYS